MLNNILIIDDDTRLRDLLENYLVEKNFNVYQCDDYVSADEILKYFTFDLIIVDRMMPTGDGVNLIKVIKKRKPTPVIMLTARGEISDRVVGLDLGADDYMPKPFEPRELLARTNSIWCCFSPAY